VLWQRDAETSRAPASLTKLITAMVAVDDSASLDQVVQVAKAATQISPSVMGLSPGERLTVRQLLDGLFLDSGNDAAEALARGIVPRDRFIRQMNQKALSIGLTASHFVNPSGLDAAGHGMSAHDLVHVAAYLEKYYPELAAIAATREISIPASSTHKAVLPAQPQRPAVDVRRRHRPQDRSHRQRGRMHAGDRHPRWEAPGRRRPQRHRLFSLGRHDAAELRVRHSSTPGVVAGPDRDPIKP